LESWKKSWKATFATESDISQEAVLDLKDV